MSGKRSYNNSNSNTNDLGNLFRMHECVLSVYFLSMVSGRCGSVFDVSYDGGTMYDVVCVVFSSNMKLFLSEYTCVVCIRLEGNRVCPILW